LIKEKPIIHIKTDYKIVTYSLYTVSLHVCVLRDSIKYAYKSIKNVLLIYIKLIGICTDFSVKEKE